MDEYQLERIILDNSTRYEGKANMGSVMGTLLGVHPELKAKAKELMPKIQKAVEHVNSMSLETQKGMHSLIFLNSVN